MKAFIGAFITLAALAAVSAKPGGDPNQEITPKIIQGTQATDGQFPFMVRLVSFRGVETQCGGTILNEKFILTAAHCVFPVPLWTKGQIGALRANDTRRDNCSYEVTVDRHILHPLFNRLTFDNDIALLRVRETMRLNCTNSRPVCLPPSNTTQNLTGNGTAIGWGSTAEGSKMANDLLFARLPIQNNTYCRKQYPNYNATRMMCAGFLEGGADSCQGDSGGPFVDARVGGCQLGITSYGNGCGKKDYPGVYTRVSNYIAWINETIRRNNDTSIGIGPLPIGGGRTTTQRSVTDGGSSTTTGLPLIGGGSTTTQGPSNSTTRRPIIGGGRTTTAGTTSAASDRTTRRPIIGGGRTTTASGNSTTTRLPIIGRSTTARTTTAASNSTRRPIIGGGRTTTARATTARATTASSTSTTARTTTASSTSTTGSTSTASSTSTTGSTSTGGASDSTTSSTTTGGGRNSTTRRPVVTAPVVVVIMD